MMPMLIITKNGSRSNWSDIDCDEFDEIYNIQVNFVLFSNFTSKLICNVLNLKIKTRNEFGNIFIIMISVRSLR